MSNQTLVTQHLQKDKSELEKFRLFYEFVETKAKKAASNRPLQR